jgi:hypothetical protein
VPISFDSHASVGIDRPAYVYPLFEQALSAAIVFLAPT